MAVCSWSTFWPPLLLDKMLAYFASRITRGIEYIPPAAAEIGIDLSHRVSRGLRRVLTGVPRGRG